MKIFTAVEIPPAVAHQIEKQTSALRDDYPEFNWVPLSNLHISLHYIGSAPEANIPPIADGIADEIYDVPATQVYSFGVDLFINTEQIILYMSIKRNKVLEELHERIMALFASDLQQKKDVYIPHVTLARYKIPSKQQYFHLKRKLSKTDIDVEFPVNEIQLYESIARSKNPEYKKLRSIPLVKE